MTFCATINAVIHANATPVLQTSSGIPSIWILKSAAEPFSPERKQLCRCISRVVLVAIALALARQYDLRIIEDCAHAIETEYRGQKAGAIGDCGVLSFYSTKNIVTGEGGMLLTNDEEGRRASQDTGLARYVAGCLEAIFR